MESCPDCLAPYQVKTKFGMTFEVPTCQCHDKKLAEERKKEYQLAADEQIKEKFLKLGLGPLDRFTLDSDFDPKWPEGFRSVEEFLDGKQRNIGLIGSPGTHKTTFLKGLIHKVFQHQVYHGKVYKIRGGYVPTIFSKLKDMDNIQEYRAWLMGGDMLVLDDVDKLLATAYEMNMMLSLVNNYWTDGKPILFTANRNRSYLKGKFMGRNVDEEDIEPILSRLWHNQLTVEMAPVDSRNNTSITFKHLVHVK